MESVNPRIDSYSFGSFELFPRRGELRKHGITVRIAPQPFRVLVFLVEKASEIVTRQELRALNWGDDVIVDFEMGLNRWIRRVRAVLMDDADEPRYLETIPKTGYRFIAPIKAAASLLDAEPPLTETEVQISQLSMIARSVLPRKYFPTRQGVFYVIGDLYRSQSLMFYSTTSKTAELVAKFDHPIDEGIGLSPDGSHLFYGQVDQAGNDLLLVDKFWH